MAHYRQDAHIRVSRSNRIGNRARGPRETNGPVRRATLRWDSYRWSQRISWFSEASVRLRLGKPNTQRPVRLGVNSWAVDWPAKRTLTIAWNRVHAAKRQTCIAIWLGADARSGGRNLHEIQVARHGRCIVIRCVPGAVDVEVVKPMRTDRTLRTWA